ncbi:MAG: hypothetical protein R3D60_08110 [Paracoccaceae bacterium]
MKFLSRPSLAALAAALTLSGCIDIDVTATITAADRAEVSGHMEIQRMILDNFGGTQHFCNADEGGTLTLTDTTARCDFGRTGAFAEVFPQASDDAASTVTDLGDGTVRVSIPLGDVMGDMSDVSANPAMAAQFRPMLEGHGVTIRVAGAEIVSSNGEIAPDGLSASYTFDLVDVLNPDLSLPAAFETVVRY